MKKSMKVTFLVVLTLGVFAGVAAYDADGRADRLHRSSFLDYDLCQRMAEQASSDGLECVAAHREALEASESLALLAALPLALGAVAVLWVLIGLVYLMRRRRADTTAAQDA